MINIRIQKNKIIVSGHAEYAPKGFDIVCASVSSLCGAAISALNELDIEYKYEQDPKKAYLMIEITDPDQQSDTIFTLLICGFINVHEQYSDHVSLVFCD